MERCACHPECRESCRREDHPEDARCVWPHCLTAAEMRALLRDETPRDPQ
jgi:hypothetical protein